MESDLLRLSDLLVLAYGSVRELQRKHLLRYHYALSNTLLYALDEALELIQKLRREAKRMEEKLSDLEMEIMFAREDMRRVLMEARFWRKAYTRLAFGYVEQNIGRFVEVAMDGLE